MNPSQPLIPAAELAALNRCTYPNESEAYRQARNALLVEEIELRRRDRAGGRAASRAAAGRRGDARLPLRGRGRRLRFR